MESTMKKLFVYLTIAGMLTFGLNAKVQAEEAQEPETEVTEAVEEEISPADALALEAEEEEAEDQTFHYILKEKFIEGGAGFMSIILLCLIIGLGLCIERIIYLNLASTNTTKLLNKVEEALQSGGVDAAKELCKSTRDL